MMRSRVVLRKLELAGQHPLAQYYEGSNNATQAVTRLM